MREIAGSRFIINSEAVLVLGPPGVRQDAHLAVAVGREARLLAFSDYKKRGRLGGILTIDQYCIHNGVQHFGRFWFTHWIRAL